MCDVLADMETRLARLRDDAAVLATEYDSACGSLEKTRLALQTSEERAWQTTIEL